MALEGGPAQSVRGRSWLLTLWTFLFGIESRQNAGKARPVFGLLGLIATDIGALIVVAVVAYILMLVVSLATSVKRWHNRNKSGAWIPINVIPLIGALWSLIEQGFLGGDSGPNRFGDPASGSALGD